MFFVSMIKYSHSSLLFLTVAMIQLRGFNVYSSNACVDTQTWSHGESEVEVGDVGDGAKMMFFIESLFLQNDCDDDDDM